MVIFDLDGTLYDYESCNAIAEQKLVKVAVEQLNISEQDFLSAFVQAKKDVKKQLGDVAAAHNRFLYMQRVCELTNKNPFMYTPVLYNSYWNAILDNMRLFPYVRPLFEYMHAEDIKIAILTDLTVQIQYRKIKQLGIGEYIDYIVTSEEAGEEKPSRKMYQKLLEKTSYNIDEVLMIGDSWPKDILGAHNMGIKAILFYGQDNFERIIKNEIVNCSTLLQ